MAAGAPTSTTPPFLSSVPAGLLIALLTSARQPQGLPPTLSPLTFATLLHNLVWGQDGTHPCRWLPRPSLVLVHLPESENEFAIP